MPELTAKVDVIKATFQRAGSLLSFTPGQLLSDPRYIPGQIFVINTGSSRLVAHHNGRLCPIDHLGPGTLVGAISLLSRRPIEHVRASEELTAYALTDKDFLEQLNVDLDFRHAVMTAVFPAEILNLTEEFCCDAKTSRAELIGSYKELLAQTEVIALSKGSDMNMKDYQAGQFYLSATLGSASKGISGWVPLDPTQLEFVSGGDLLEHRILFRPESTKYQQEANNVRPTVSLETSTGPKRPLVSRFNQEDSEQTFPHLVLAKGEINEAMACFQMISKIFNLPYRKDAIEKVLVQYTSRDQVISLRLYAQIASGLGLHVTASSVDINDIDRLEVPSLIERDSRVSIVVRNDERGLEVASPAEGITLLTKTDFTKQEIKTINVVHLDKKSSTQEARFGFSWFLPALKKHKSVLIQVLIATFVIQLFTLANPLLIQVIIDKVVTQRSLDTLQVLGIALVVVTVFEGVLGSLKTFLFTETTNRIDQRLGAEVIDHLLRLPLSYFDKRPVGELGSRISELEKIRKFLTGQALTTIIDAIFSVIYIAVMLLYSVVLSAVALSVLPIQIGLTLLGAPVFRRQYRDAAEANAKTQSHLVEVLTGIQTVKSQNVEIMSRSTWQEHYSSYITKTFSQTITGTALSQISQVLQKISQLLVLWVGAVLVLQGSLTLGQLIAFRIISGYVTQPLLRLSSIWQSIQELKVSFERLADVINTPQESTDEDQGKLPMSAIKGSVSFRDICFSFSPSSPPVLKKVNLEIPAGTFVGVVGQSGSGKSTLMKLLPRLYTPDTGTIVIDNYDITKVELYSLRRQIGIVPQDPLLFSGSIAENIALTQPDASSDEIVESAKLACAHEFIMGLPDGYSTKIGERGSSLSGGQRQRIAVARTLLANPRLLIMDEATSALDYETERSLCDNLITGLGEKTVFFVTHRLSTVRRADLIVVMHQGLVSELGTHDELMGLKGRYYALYRQQEHQ